MREIKFRVWSPYWKRMVNHNECAPSIEYKGDGILQLYANSFVLMQYTGLEDKNGNSIYDGDIIKDRFNTGAVSFDETVGAWSWPHGENWGMIFTDSVEIIGNIYENPELTRGKSDV